MKPIMLVRLDASLHVAVWLLDIFTELSKILVRSVVILCTFNVCYQSVLLVNNM